MAESPHFEDEFFQAAVIGDGLEEGVRLRRRERHGDALGFHFAGPAPGAGMVLGDRALAQPIEAADLLFAALKPRPQRGHFGG